MHRKISFLSLMIILMLLVFPEIGFSKPKPDPQLQKLEAEFEKAKSNRDKATIGMKLARYCLAKNNDACVNYANSAIKAAKAAKMTKTQAELHSVIGNYYYKNKNYKKAVLAFEAEYALRKKNQQAKSRAITCYNIGYCYYKLGFQKKAIKSYEESMALAKKLGDKPMIDRLTRSLSDVSIKQRDYKSAYEYLNKYLKAENQRFKEEYALLQDSMETQSMEIVAKDSTIQVVEEQKKQLEMSKQLLEAQKSELEAIQQAQKLELEKQALENHNLEVEKENASLWRNILAISGGSLILILVFVIRSVIIKKKTNKRLRSLNEEIKATNEELSQKNQIIELKNKDITDSLNYAGKIQMAMLRDFTTYSKLMTDYFIFYAPKDIVSGDFYWAHKVGDKFIFTVGDCTGHSVPGAFMSMLGIALLNQIVAQQHETQASKILEQMRALVKSYLGQTGINEEPKDGMDMSLCVWDVKTNEGNYSGAYNPLWQIRNGELKTFEAVKNPVGIHTREVPFQDSFFQIEKGDKYYMFSDGYCDQFSGTRHEKYKTTRFKKMLLETAGLTMNQQGDMITKNYWDWKGDFVQIDDVCVLGVEI